MEKKMEKSATSSPQNNNDTDIGKIKNENNSVKTSMLKKKKLKSGFEMMMKLREQPSMKILKHPGWRKPAESDGNLFNFSLMSGPMVKSDTSISSTGALKQFIRPQKQVKHMPQIRFLIDDKLAKQALEVSNKLAEMSVREPSLTSLDSEEKFEPRVFHSVLRHPDQELMPTVKTCPLDKSGGFRFVSMLRLKVFDEDKTSCQSKEEIKSDKDLLNSSKSDEELFGKIHLTDGGGGGAIDGKFEINTTAKCNEKECAFENIKEKFQKLCKMIYKRHKLKMISDSVDKVGLFGMKKFEDEFDSLSDDEPDKRQIKLIDNFKTPNSDLDKQNNDPSEKLDMVAKDQCSK